MDMFKTFAQNIDCGYTLEPSRNEYPQSRFWIKNKKNMYTPAYPSFTISWTGFPDDNAVFIITQPCHDSQTDNFAIYVYRKQPCYNMISLITRSVSMDQR